MWMFFYIPFGWEFCWRPPSDGHMHASVLAHTWSIWAMFHFLACCNRLTPLAHKGSLYSRESYESRPSDSWHVLCWNSLPSSYPSAACKMCSANPPGLNKMNKMGSRLRVCPKWHSYSLHIAPLFFAKRLWWKVVHYIGNRVPFGRV